MNDTLSCVTWERQWLVLYCVDCRTPVEAATDEVGLTWEALPSGHAGSSLVQGDLVRDGETYVCPPCRGAKVAAWPPQLDPNDPATLRGFAVEAERTSFKLRCVAPLCGKLFRAKHSDARFCSSACTKRAAYRRRSSGQ